MQHLPIYLNTLNALIVVSGAGETAAAKLRLLLKTDAQIRVIGHTPAATVRSWANDGRVELIERSVEPADVVGCRLLYAANDDAQEDAHAASLGRTAGAIVNVVDKLKSQCGRVRVARPTTDRRLINDNWNHTQPIHTRGRIWRRITRLSVRREPAHHGCGLCLNYR